jgi:hypothetical protein
MSKDANALLQSMKASNVGRESQAEQVRARLALAQPLILTLAREAAGLQGVDQDEAMKGVLSLARTMSEADYGYYEKRLSKALGMGITSMRGMARPKSKKKTERGDGEPQRVAGGWIGGTLLELVFDPVKIQTWFAVRYPDGRVEPYVERVEINGTVYMPTWPNSIMTKHGVRFPSQIYDRPLPEKELLAITRAHVMKFFDFGSDDFFKELAPHFVPYTYFADAFMEASYLRALGDYGTGKTRFLKAIGLLCYRPVYVTGGSSAASIYHYLDVYRGTLILNEADFGESDEASIISKILNGGTERDEGISKMRKDPNGNMEIEMYNVFGPKVIATRKAFDDRAIESRCMTMEMVPIAVDPRIPRHLPTNYEVTTREIRNLWTTYRLYHAQELIAIDEKQTDYSLEPRLSQVTGPLMGIITDEQVREEIKAFMREYNERTKSERYQTQTARVLEGIMRAWAWGAASSHPGDESRIYLKDVAAATNAITDEMNLKMGDTSEEEGGEEGASEGKWRRKKSGGKMTSRGISKTMTKYLQLRTWRATSGVPDYKGTMYIDMERDQGRIEALCKRWGVEWLEYGCQAAKRPNAGLPMGDPYKKDREEWHQTGIEGEKGEA